MREETIAALIVESLASFATRRGANRRELLRRSGLTEESFADPHGRLPLDRYRDLFVAAGELTSDPAIALHHAEAVDVTELSLGPTVAAASGSPMQVFEGLNRYARLGADVATEGGGDRFAVGRAGGFLWLTDRRLNPNSFPELSESTFARIVCSTRRSLGSIPIFRAVHFTHTPRCPRAEYERIFAVPVTFESDRNALGLDEGVMNRVPRPDTPALVAAALRDRADALLDQLDSERGLREQVEAILSEALPNGKASVQHVASELAVSRQTLFRRLKAEGVTFAEVLDDLRRRLADHYLKDLGHPVGQTAAKLGYSDSTAFSRAYRRWTGSAPGTNRRNP